MKRGYQKVFAAILGIVMLFTLMASSGCSQSASTVGGKVDLSDPSKIKGKITYWVNQDWNDANKEVIDRFQKEYPNIKVKMTPFTYDTLIEKLRAAYAGKKESDVQQIFGDWAIDLMRHERLDEVPEEMAEDARNRYYESALGGYTYEGKLYGIPREFNIENGGVLYYPADLEKVGYKEFPKTYAEFVEAAKKMSQADSKGNLTHWGFDFLTSDNITYLFLSFILQQGADYWDDDKIHVKFNTPEGEKALQEMVDLVVKHKVTEIMHLSDANNEAHVAFFKGLSSMCFRGPWVIPEGLNDFGLDNFKYGPMPSFTGDSLAFAAESGWGDVVSARSKNRAAAWLFIKYTTSPELNEVWNSITYTIPAEKSIAQSPSFVEKNPMIKTSLDILEYGRPIGPLMSIDAFKSDIMENHFTKLCTGAEDVKTALKNIEEETNKMIDERRAQ